MSSLRILYLGDPGSVHDVKWMMAHGDHVSRFLVLREHHARSLGAEWLEDWSTAHQVKIVGVLKDFSLVRFWVTLFQVLRLRRWIVENRIEMVHIFFAEPNSLWTIFRGYLDVPVVLTTRGTDVLKTIPQFFQRTDILGRCVALLYSLALPRVDIITSTSLNQAEALEACCPTLKGRVKIVRTGVSIRELETNIGGQLGEDLTGCEYVLFPRVMRPIYQHEFALQAISRLEEHIRARYRFVFVDHNGSDRAYVDAIEREMESISAEFLFLDSLSQRELHLALKYASLVVMTPRSDGSSVTAAEAMLCRVPLILPPLPYDQELFSRGPFVFRDWRPESLAELMVTVLEGEWSSRLDQGYQDAATRFDRAREMERLWGIYGTALNRRECTPEWSHGHQL